MRSISERLHGRVSFLLIILLSAFSFTGCKTTRSGIDTLQGSLDDAKTAEKGRSRVEYDPKTGVNVIVWDEEPFGLNINSLDRELEEATGTAKPASGVFSGRIGFGYVGKGTKQKEGDGKLALNYLEVPIQGVYRYPIATGSPAEGNAYAGFGPYFAYGIGGKAKEGGFQESSFGDGSDNAGYKRFDAGLAFTLGYKLTRGFSLDLGYELGLANNISAGQDVKSHNRCLSINLGYEISKLFKK